MSRLLIVKCGGPDPAVRAAYGSYEAWFRMAMGEEAHQWALLDAEAGDPLPDLVQVDGILVTGSPRSVREEAPWMVALGHWLVSSADRGLPVLAVCFGHQLVGEALGGRVEQNPAGQEIGTIEVQLTPAGRADPLFAGLAGQIEVQSIHGDCLVRPPSAPGVRQLASSHQTDWQAFAYGPYLRAVQFHPELTAATLAHLVSVQGQAAEVRPGLVGRRILENWVGTLTRTS